MNSKNAPMQNLQVHYTKDLSMFRELTGNRNVNLQHVRRLEKSMTDNGMLINPIIVNERYEVVDGQHRLMAARNIESGIYYIIAEGYSLHQVQTLNENQKNWTLLDFAHGYSEIGNKNYQTLIEFVEEWGMPITTCIMLLGSANSYTNSNSKNNFRAGRWIVANEKEARINANNLKKLASTHKFCLFPRFVSAILPIFEKKEFKIKELIERVQKRPKMFVQCATASQYRLMIEDVYNYRRRNKINLRY